MARRLTKLTVDEVSVVDKGANNKRFLILKHAKGPEEPGSIRKAGRPPLRGRAREAFRKVAGTSGQTDGGIDMTPEDVKKAVAEAAGPILGPLYERLEMLESVVAKATDEMEDEDIAKSANDSEITMEAVKQTVADTVTEMMAPVIKRLEAVETASGRRRSGLEEGGAHQVTKSADGKFSWSGCGLF